MYLRNNIILGAKNQSPERCYPPSPLRLAFPLRFRRGVIRASENIFPPPLERAVHFLPSLGRSFDRKKGGWGERASERARAS